MPPSTVGGSAEEIAAFAVLISLRTSLKCSGENPPARFTSKRNRRTARVMRFCREVEERLGRTVDLATEQALHPLIRDRVLAEAVPL